MKKSVRKYSKHKLKIDFTMKFFFGRYFELECDENEL